MTPSISFIICTHNGLSRIRPAISSICRLQGINEVKAEIIIVNNNSTEDLLTPILKTFNYYKQKLNLALNLKVVDEKKMGISFARSTGLKASNHELIAFIDDDNYLLKNWLNEVIAFTNENPVFGAVGGNNHLISNQPVPEWIKKDWLKAFACGPQDSRYLYGAGLVIRKSVADIIFGFQEKVELHIGRKANGAVLSGEDYLYNQMISKLGLSLYYNPKMQLNHCISPNRLNHEYIKNLTCSFVFSIYLQYYLRQTNCSMVHNTIIFLLEPLNIFISIKNTFLKFLQTNTKESRAIAFEKTICSIFRLFINPIEKYKHLLKITQINRFIKNHIESGGTYQIQ